MPRIRGKIAFDGAIVTVRIELGAPDEASRRASGQPVSPPFATTALFDIGASRTAVHPMILDQLGANQTGLSRSVVPGHPEERVANYDVRLAFGTDRHAFEVRVVRVAPATHTAGVLIGRDILERGTLLFDGEGETFSFWF